jgi:flavin reductase (DIM6/NTAB) family NADH-FMN oxidoreductase RutF
MTLQHISAENLTFRTYDIWANQWPLLISGDFSAGRFNTMTIGWGSMGTMWNKPFVQVVVRPSRYTYEFMERYDTFTLNVLPEAYRPALELLGSKSGRSGDKISEAGLTPMASNAVAAPCFQEAELILECRKMYWDDLAPAHFIDAEIPSHYPDGDYHRMYFGEIQFILGIGAYSKTGER